MKRLRSDRVNELPTACTVPVIFTTPVLTLNPQVTNMGYQNAFILAAFVGMAQVLTFLVFVKWGKKWRAQTTQKYLRYVQEIVAKGGAH